MCPTESPYCGSMFLQPTPHSSCCCSDFQQPPLGTVNTALFTSPTGTKAGTDTPRCKGGAYQGAYRTDVNSETDLPGCCFLLQSHCLWTSSLDSISDDSPGAGSKQASGRLPGELWRGHRKQLRTPIATYATLGRQHHWPRVPWRSSQGRQRMGWFCRQGNPVTEGSCPRPFTRWS